MTTKDFTLIVVLEEQKNNEQHWNILHQCLLMLFDSPLNHACLLEVYISLYNGNLIKLHREVRIPRTYKRFEQLFCNFLQGCDMPLVQTKDGLARLLQFANRSEQRQLKDLNDQTAFKKFKIVNLSPKVKNPDYFTNPLTDTRTNRIALFIEFGPVDFNILGVGKETEYELKTVDRHPNQETYSVSRYPIAPSIACVKLTTSFEKALDIF